MDAENGSTSAPRLCGSGTSHLDVLIFVLSYRFAGVYLHIDKIRLPTQLLIGDIALV